MLKEFELQTISHWVATPSFQDSENLASKSHETRRIPDPYIFLIKNGKLETPSGYEVEKSVLTGTKVYDAEYDALLKIQDWANINDEGLSFWFSPPYPGGYESLKIVASEILYAISGEKVLFNRAIVIDVDCSTSLEIANHLSNNSFRNPEELRKSPIFLSAETTWVELLALYTKQAEQIKSSEDLIIKQKTLKGINNIYDEARRHKMTVYQARDYAEREARERGLIGDKQDSCTTGKQSAFNTLFNGTLSENSLGSFPCPRCNGPIPSGLGITTCPHCGLTKEQAGSTCG